MGKRRRTSSTNNNTNQNNPSSSDHMPCSSTPELLSTKKSSHLLDSTELKAHSLGMDVTDSTAKLLNAHSSDYNVGRSMFLKRSRHHYGHHYSRRSSGNHINTSTSHGKLALLQDERLPFKLIGHPGSEFGRHSYAEIREKSFSRQDRIRISSSVTDASDSMKMICGICQKVFRRKPYFLGDALSSGECSIVAVLVCGHVYHADCLEEKTSYDDRRDPLCPSCSGLINREDAGVL